MAIIEIDTASAARRFFLALLALVKRDTTRPYPPFRVVPIPTGLRFDATNGHLAFQIEVSNAGCDREGVLMFTEGQIKALASTLAATDKRPGFDLWRALEQAHVPTEQVYPPFEKVLELHRAASTNEWGCVDLGKLAQVEGVLKCSTSRFPMTVLLRCTAESILVEAGPVRGVVMGARR